MNVGNVWMIQDLVEDVQYKVNVYALVHGEVAPEVYIESKELHEKVILIDGCLSVYTEEMEE